MYVEKDRQKDSQRNRQTDSADRPPSYGSYLLPCDGGERRRQRSARRAAATTQR
jgi:hypothetical protein